MLPDEVFAALGDPTRLRIVQMLAQRGEMCVCHIVDELAMNQPAVSHHIAKLKQAGLLNARKKGQWIYYSLNIDALKMGALAFLTEVVTLLEKANAAADDACCER